MRSPNATAQGASGSNPNRYRDSFRPAARSDAVSASTRAPTCSQAPEGARFASARTTSSIRAVRSPRTRALKAETTPATIASPPAARVPPTNAILLAAASRPPPVPAAFVTLAVTGAGGLVAMMCGSILWWPLNLDQRWHCCPEEPIWWSDLKGGRAADAPPRSGTACPLPVRRTRAHASHAPGAHWPVPHALRSRERRHGDAARPQ